MMTSESWLEKAVQQLERANIGTARLDSEVLLCDVLHKDRSWILAHGDYPLSTQDLKRLESQITRRAKHEPLAYIRGKQEFYGRDFFVTPATLTPRPETETMLELLFKQIKDRRSKIENKVQIIDIGTGSGCIIITASLGLSKLSDIKYPVFFHGLDISEEALKIAQKNAKIHKVDIEFKKIDIKSGDLSKILDPRFKIICLANLPYVPTNFSINLSATHEPPEAIFGGADGLDLYRVLFKKLSPACQYVFTESLPPQHKELESIANRHGFKLQKTQDFIQVFTR